MGIKRVLGLQSSLNPQSNLNVGEKVLAGLNAVVIRQLWLDYCNFTFGNEEDKKMSTKALSIVILREMKLLLHAERGLLVKDLNWWENKFNFKPAMEGVKEIQLMIGELKARIESFRLLLGGEVSEEFASLAWEEIPPQS